MGTITDRNSKDLTEAEEIKRRLRGGKNTQKKCWGKKKILMTQITTMVWSLTRAIHLGV